MSISFSFLLHALDPNFRMDNFKGGPFWKSRVRPGALPIRFGARISLSGVDPRGSTGSVMNRV